MNTHLGPTPPKITNIYNEEISIGDRVSFIVRNQIFYGDVEDLLQDGDASVRDDIGHHHWVKWHKMRLVESSQQPISKPVNDTMDIFKQLVTALALHGDNCGACTTLISKAERIIIQERKNEPTRTD